jgi:UDP-N-acetylglucosamine 2-epimerase (non-hydrolysing)
LHVAGARPNFPKLAPVHAALRERGVGQCLVHTGQHFDDALSGVFFRELNLPEPDMNLGVAGGTDVDVIARIMLALDQVIPSIAPECVVVYGDVNSTVAAAMVAVKSGIPVAHVEAGLRSGDRSMPEEINRILTDHLSSLHFATSSDAIENLAAEGVATESIHMVGNPMIDTLLQNMDKFDGDSVRARYGLPERYAAVTIHRPANVDSTADAMEIVGAIHAVAEMIDVVFPMHPRGRERLIRLGMDLHPRVHILPPLGYLEFMGLVRGARLVLTDSGGVQEETTMFGVPCLTIRPNTERPITITHGTNRLVKREHVAAATSEVLQAPTVAAAVPPLWDGSSGSRIAERLVEMFAEESTPM